MTKELYEEAISDEPVTETEETEQPESKEEASAKVRDERGRFVKAEAKEEAPEAEEATAEEGDESETEQSEPEAQPETQLGRQERGLLTELLNERERRQTIQKQLEEYQRSLEQMQRQMAPKPQVPDQFAEPENYNAYWHQQLEALRMEQQNAIRHIQSENSLARAHDKYGEDFEKGYQEVMDRAAKGDPTAARMIVNSPNPGEAIVDWYRRESTLKEVGTDVNAYAAKILEAALDNPEFLAKALEKAEGVARTKPTQVKIPPSLNKATSAARADDMGPVSDVAMYHHAIGR